MYAITWFLALNLKILVMVSHKICQSYFCEDFWVINVSLSVPWVKIEKKITRLLNIFQTVLKFLSVSIRWIEDPYQLEMRYWKFSSSFFVQKQKLQCSVKSSYRHLYVDLPVREMHALIFYCFVNDPLLYSRTLFLFLYAL